MDACPPLSTEHIQRDHCLHSLCPHVSGQDLVLNVLGVDVNEVRRVQYVLPGVQHVVPGVQHVVLGEIQ